MALGLAYGCPIDLWSTGVILAEVALRRPLLLCHTPLELLQQVVGLLGPLPAHMARAAPLGQHVDLRTLSEAAEEGAGAQARGWAGTGPGGAQSRSPFGPLLHRPQPLPLAARRQQQQQPQALAPGRAARQGPAALPGGMGLAGSGQLETSDALLDRPLYQELARVDVALADLVTRLLTYNPSQRITAHQVRSRQGVTCQPLDRRVFAARGVGDMAENMLFCWLCCWLCCEMPYFPCFSGL